ncbi:hypothetical protein J6590_010539 [Homalodisca vitripennis]|nr:hypothetical protein J6590_010539 [Homalodisca vitripennis]
MVPAMRVLGHKPHLSQTRPPPSSPTIAHPFGRPAPRLRLANLTTPTLLSLLSTGSDFEENATGKPERKSSLAEESLKVEMVGYTNTEVNQKGTNIEEAEA